VNGVRPFSNSTLPSITFCETALVLESIFPLGEMIADGPEFAANTTYRPFSTALKVLNAII
jgi:hypothetical protein